jgi:outer membrane protein
MRYAPTVLRARTVSIWFAAIAVMTSGSALAEEVLSDEPADTLKYVVGLAATSSSSYPGSANNDFKLRPLWALQYGRLRISTSRAGGFMSNASETVNPGASAELIRHDRLKIGAGLRVDGGRSPSDDPLLASLPEIRRTLRARVYASYAITDQWGISTGVTQDLLGREGGATAVMDTSYRTRLSPQTELLLGGGLSFGNGKYMNSYFGVPQASSLQSGLPAYQPGAGIRDVHAAIGLTTHLSDRWIIFGALNLSRLLGDAASSPLTQKSSNVGGSIGLAYRCCD